MPIDSPLAPFVDARAKRAVFSVSHPQPRTREPVESLLAGASEVDITPPPGMPKAGHSSNARDGEGFRSRLFSRVVHLRHGTQSIALVQSDLLTGSSILQHLVADAVSERTDIDISGLLFAVNHTHAAPGQFHDCDFYNKFSSNRGGFDPAWTHFLVERISSAVIDAHDNRRPATAAMGFSEVRGLAKNRSMAPYRNNSTVTGAVDPKQCVDPRLHVLRVDGADGRPISASVIYGIHGTSVSSKTPDYNADLWAHTVATLRAGIAAETGVQTVVAGIQGTHADTTPAMGPDGHAHAEAQRIGSALGDAALDRWRALEADLSVSLPLGVALREVDLATPSRSGIRLAARPAVGAALLAGAIENSTPVVASLPGIKPGHPRTTPRGDHGHKRTVGGRLQRLTLPPNLFPRHAPLHVLRIGTTAIVATPFETTTESGRRMADAVLGELADSGVDTIAVTSIANSYFGYVTTPEEYALQYYEGGHTLFGPNTLPYLTDELVGLAAEVAEGGATQDVASPRTFDLKIKRFLARPNGIRPRRIVAEPTWVDAADPGPCWEVQWSDSSPGALSWHEPLVAVQEEIGDGWETIVTDSSPMLEVLLRSSRGGRFVYRARWFSEPPNGAYRFTVLPSADNEALASDTFAVLNVEPMASL